MPVTYFNVTDIAHDDYRMEDQLLQETGRKYILDPNWTTRTAAAQGFHSFLYQSDIEFILIKTESKVKFRRIAPIDTETELASIRWDHRTGEQYYIFKIDPTQQIIITGSPTVRFFRYPQEEEEVSMYEESKIKKPSWKRERHGCPWEAEDVYQQRDVVADETFPPEHFAEVARRFKAWRAMNKGSLFVYFVVPKQLSERELDLLIESGVSLVTDVSWVV